MLGGALVLRQPPSISIPLRDHQIAGDFQRAKKTSIEFPDNFIANDSSSR
jgi:hypothetical protein